MNAVYMLASRRHGTIYIGVTSNLIGRVSQHREEVHDGFTKRYGVKRLVWIEWHDSIEAAIHREKRLKKYKREWKINLIERENREWEDLYPEFPRRGPARASAGARSVRVTAATSRLAARAGRA